MAMHSDENLLFKRPQLTLILSTILLGFGGLWIYLGAQTNQRGVAFI